MNKLLVVTVIAIIMIGLIGATMTVPQASYATKQSKQVPPEKTTVPPERQSQQPSEAPGATTERPERQSQFNSEQQEDGISDATEQKDEQIRDVLQEEDDDENNGSNEEQSEQIEIDKKAPIAISGDNAYIVWFNDQNTPNNILNYYLDHLMIADSHLQIRSI
ncbi:MAG: hypothetical protein WA941_13870 [Nitrososphaeraceae archaeon]